ncbi:hypothetical protein [Vagococcus penaei]|nr:hypothetical protein [Vagococcus penaei]
MRQVTFYSYHSISRGTIIKQIISAQIISSLIFSLSFFALTEAVQWLKLSAYINLGSDSHSIYVTPLSLGPIVSPILVGLLLMECLFLAMLFANTLAIIGYSWKFKKLIIVLSILLGLIILILVSVPYWPAMMKSYVLFIISLIVGTGQNMVPAVVIPFGLMFLIILGLIIYNLHAIKKIQINKMAIF